MTKKFIDTLETLDDAEDFEVAGFETIAKILKAQQKTQREGLTMLSEVALAFIGSMTTDNAAIRENEKRRIELEERRLELEEKRLNAHFTKTQSSCECIAAKDDAVVPKAPLASKSGKAAKPKTKARSTAGKKAP